jgi:hypothetical protein
MNLHFAPLQDCLPASASMAMWTYKAHVLINHVQAYTNIANHALMISALEKSFVLAVATTVFLKDNSVGAKMGCLTKEESVLVVGLLVSCASHKLCALLAH